MYPDSTFSLRHACGAGIDIEGGPIL